MSIRDTDSMTLRLVDELVEYQMREIAAWAADDTNAVNRNVAQIIKRLDLLKGTRDGRTALEDLMSHELPEVRLTAAGAVLAWAPEKAIPVLGRIVAERRPPSPDKPRQPIAFDAAISLYEHWGIRSYNRDDLIEPLARYGIELEPRR